MSTLNNFWYHKHLEDTQRTNGTVAPAPEFKDNEVADGGVDGGGIESEALVPVNAS